jgi:probable F420-dependent oxidoreductase
MRFGLFGINTGPCADPETARRVASAAESSGFDSLWTGEHVVLPDPQVPPSPVPPETPFLDPAVSLAFVAAHTRSVLLGTGIIILPQRNPLVLAKELASVDVLSGGRLVFGLGIGYLKAEFDALGIPFTDKGARSMEYLAAMRAVWMQERPAYAGRFVAFRSIQSLPRPRQRPHPPIVIGGHTPPAFRRATAHANGWYGFALDLEATRSCLTGLAEARAAVNRPAELGELEVSVTPRGRLDRDAAEQFAALGVHRLIVYRFWRTADEVLRDVEEIAGTLIGQV